MGNRKIVNNKRPDKHKKNQKFEQLKHLKICVKKFLLNEKSKKFGFVSNRRTFLKNGFVIDSLQNIESQKADIFTRRQTKFFPLSNEQIEHYMNSSKILVKENFVDNSDLKINIPKYKDFSIFEKTFLVKNFFDEKKLDIMSVVMGLKETIEAKEQRQQQELSVFIYPEGKFENAVVLFRFDEHERSSFHESRRIFTNTKLKFNFTNQSHIHIASEDEYCYQHVAKKHFEEKGNIKESLKVFGKFVAFEVFTNGKIVKTVEKMWEVMVKDMNFPNVISNIDCSVPLDEESTIKKFPNKINCSTCVQLSVDEKTLQVIANTKYHHNNGRILATYVDNPNADRKLFHKI